MCYTDKERVQGRLKSFRHDHLEGWDCHRDEKGCIYKSSFLWEKKKEISFGQGTLGYLLGIQMAELRKELDSQVWNSGKK